MTELDLPQEDMEFLERALGNTPSSEGLPLTSKELIEWIVKCGAVEGRYQEMYDRIGKRMLVNLGAAKLIQGGDGVRLYTAMATDEALGRQIMEYAVAYGEICFVAGYEAGKEADDES